MHPLYAHDIFMDVIATCRMYLHLQVFMKTCTIFICKGAVLCCQAKLRAKRELIRIVSEDHGNYEGVLAFLSLGDQFY